MSTVLDETQPETPDQEQEERLDEDAEQEDAEREQDEQDAPQPPEQPSSLSEMERIGKGLDRLGKDVRRRTEALLGPMMEFYCPCELCGATNTPGFRLAEGLPDSAREAVAHAIGERAPSDYQQDTDSRACPGCNGLGEVLTGSKVRGQEALPCFDCAGRGWVDDGASRRNAARAVATSGVPAGTNGHAHEAPAFTPPAPDTPEVAALRAQGYTVIAPSHGS